MLPIQTSQTYNNVKDYLRTHIGTQRGVDMMAAWVMSTWIVGYFDSVIGLCIRPSKKGVGASTILHTVGSICKNPVYAHQSTHNLILESLNRGCTLLVDDYSIGNEEMDAVLISGSCRRTSYVFRASEKDNRSVFIEKYSVYGPKMIVAVRPISNNPMIASRFMTISVRQPGKARLFSTIDEAEKKNLQNQLSAWAVSFSRKMWSHGEFIYWLEAGGE